MHYQASPATVPQPHPSLSLLHHTGLLAASQSGPKPFLPQGLRTAVHPPRGGPYWSPFCMDISFLLTSQPKRQFLTVLTLLKVFLPIVTVASPFPSDGSSCTSVDSTLCEHRKAGHVVHHCTTHHARHGVWPTAGAQECSVSTDLFSNPPLTGQELSAIPF